jgi:hypothetical protein
MTKRRSQYLLPALLLVSAAAGAHHAVSMVYQPERVVSVSGVVEEFRFHNPHCVIFLTRTNDAGQQERWAIEWAGSSALRRQGLTAETLKPGDAITVTGFPARDGSPGMAMQVLEFADGRPTISPPDRSGANE